MTITLNDMIEAIAEYEAWRETLAVAGPDISLTAYIRVREAERNARLVETVHSQLNQLLRGVNDSGRSMHFKDIDTLDALMKLTDVEPTYNPLGVEA